MRRIDHIVIHCSATPPSMSDIGADVIRAWHVEGNGWNDIGYHYVIKRDGKTEYGRPLERQGAHVKGHNKNSIGICWVGGVDEEGNAQDNRTACQKEQLLALLRFLKEKFPAAKIIGHRDFPEAMKDCPSFNAKKEYEQLSTHQGK